MAAKYHIALAQDPGGKLSVIEQGMDSEKVRNAYKSHEGRAKLGIFVAERSKSTRVTAYKKQAKKKSFVN
jgi:hypothetical protein